MTNTEIKYFECLFSAISDNDLSRISKVLLFITIVGDNANKFSAASML